MFITTRTDAILLNIEAFDVLRFKRTIDWVPVPNVRKQKRPTKNFMAVDMENAQWEMMLYFLGFFIDPSTAGKTVCPQYEYTMIPILIGKVFISKERILPHFHVLTLLKDKPSKRKKIMRAASTAIILNQARADSLLMNTASSKADVHTKHHSWRDRSTWPLVKSFRVFPKTIILSTQLQ